MIWVTRPQHGGLNSLVSILVTLPNSWTIKNYLLMTSDTAAVFKASEGTYRSIRRIWGHIQPITSYDAVQIIWRVSLTVSGKGRFIQ